MATMALTLDRSAMKPARVFALSATLAIHLGAFALLILPERRPIEIPPRLVLPAITLIEMATPIRPAPLPLAKPDRVKPKRLPIAVPVAVSRPVLQSVAPPDTAPAMPSDEEVVGGVPEALPEVYSGEPAEAGKLAVLFGPRPAYPRIAMRRKLEGTVVLRILVGVDGRPLEVVVEKSSGHRMLDAAAAKAAAQWRFSPATRDGSPVRSYGTLPVDFTLAGA